MRTIIIISDLFKIANFYKIEGASFIMLSYSFTDDRGFPLYEQLYQFIRDDILNGNIREFTKLPSKRSLSEQLSVSITTVENAYNQLMSEGYIESVPKVGYYVANVPKKQSGNDFKDSYIHNPGFPESYSHKPESMEISSIKPESMEIPSIKPESMGIPSHNALKSREYFADFTSNASDPETFPFTTWAKINRELLSNNQTQLMRNSPSNGLIELRSAISRYLHEFRGIAVSPENIIIGAGTETLFSILIQLLGYDLIYGTEDPGYEKIALTLNANNVKTVKIPMDIYGIMISELQDRKVNIIHTTPSHHFPTGITMPIRRRYELLNWANKSSGYIIEDDYDSEFRLSGRPIPSLMSIDNNERVIYMNTFTKSLASTIRISYMILPDHLMSLYNERLSFYSCPVSNFEQLTLAKFMSDDHYEKHINRMRTASRKKRNLLIKAIKNGPLNKISEISEEQSGLHFILTVQSKKSKDEIIEECKKRDINIVSIKLSEPLMYHSNDFTIHFMINYSSIPIERIDEAVNRLTASILG